MQEKLVLEMSCLEAAVLEMVLRHVRERRRKPFDRVWMTCDRLLWALEGARARQKAARRG